MGINISVIHIITSLNDGGAEGVLYRLCRHDQVNKHIVVSLTDAGKYGPLLEALSIPVVTLQMSPGRPSLTAFIRLFRLLRYHKPSIVQTWMYHADLFGAMAARMAGIKNVVWGIRHSTLEPGKSKKSTIWIAKLLAKLSWWIPSRIAVCAQRAMDVHEEIGYSRDKMCFIPNGYNLNDFHPVSEQVYSIRNSLQANPSIPLFGTVGRFNPQKDHASLLEAMVILRSKNIDFNCILIGTGVDENNTELVDLIRKLDLSESVCLLGRRNDIPQIMKALDVHILPSAFGEAFPNVVAEAMASGTPCIVTDVGDAAYIVGDTGWVVPPRNSPVLADAMISALNEMGSSKWEVRSNAARKRVEECFSIERMVEAYTELWNAVKEKP